MKVNPKRFLQLVVSLLVLVSVMVIALACASAEPTPVPATPAQPNQPVPPTGAPQPTATLVPGVPTAIPARPTPTRVLPTATPFAMAQPQQGGTLIYPVILNVDNFDPHHNIQVGAYGPLYAIFNNLVNRNPEDDSIVPELASRWATDGNVITFTLEEGIEFQDGTAFNAQAVKFNFDRIMDPDEQSQRRSEFVGVFDRAEVVNDSTVAIHLQLPFRPFMATLTDRAGWMSSPTAIQTHGVDYGRNPVGTGPFVFGEWVVAGHVTVRRSANYWQQGKPYLDGMRFVDVQDAQVRLAMLRTGEAHVSGVDVKDIPLVRANPDLVAIVKGTGSWAGFNINPLIPPFDEVLVRQAIAQAVDRQQLVDVLLQGGGRPAYTAQSGWAINPDLQPLPYDPQAVRDKLAQAGYPDGITVPMACLGADGWLRSCDVLQALLAQSGITAEIRILPGSDYWGPFGFIEKVGMGFNGLNQRADPHIVINWMYHTNGYFNSERISDLELDRLIEQAAGTYDIPRAKMLYDQITERGAEIANWTFMVYRDVQAGINRRVHNFNLYADAFPRLRDIWLEQ